jgi:RNA polymerase sigma-70 factor (ECF subfamily)
MTSGTAERLTDAALAAGFLRDPELFTEVHDRYFRVVYRYVAGRLGPQVAEDIAAETFLVAFDRRRTFDPERGDIRVWLC